MKQRFSPLICFVVTCALLASAIAGALGASLRFAKADFSETMYSDDLRDMIEEVNTSATVSLFLNYFESSLENGGLWVVQVSSNQQNFIFCRYIIYSRNSYSNSYFYRGNNYAACYSNSGSSTYFVLMDAFNIYNDTVTYNNYNSASAPYGIDNFDYLMDSNSNGTFGAHRYNTSFPSPETYNTDIYFSFDVYASLGGSVIYARNLFHGSAPVVFDYFEILVFWLGERKYITVKDQSYVWHMIDYDNEGEELHYFISFFVDQDDNGVPLELHWSNCQLVEGGENFIVGLTNVSPNGVYCWDITGYDYQEVYAFHEYDVVYGNEDTYAGEATNVPYDLTSDTPGENGNPDIYTQLWTEYNTYVTNYNTTPVIPDQLSSALFGVSGLQSYPVSVATPNQSLTTYKWWTLQDNLGINFDIMDVVLVHAGSAEYTLVYYYDHSLSLAFMPVQNFYLNELFDKFDCVIIIPDDKDELDTSSWWQSVLSYLADEIGLSFDFTDTGNYAVSGSSSGGVEYVSSRPSNATVVLDGFIYVTPKGVQRQQLYNFSDGITKFYKLMSDYVESEDNWKTSFLQFTAAWFTSVNTLNGSLTKILSEIESLHFDINNKLDRLIENTSEEESNFWYEPLFWFVDQFKPTLSDFTNSIDAIDDSWDTMPLLPELSPVPTIPLIGGG